MTEDVVIFFQQLLVGESRDIYKSLVGISDGAFEIRGRDQFRVLAIGLLGIGNGMIDFQGSRSNCKLLE